MDTNTLPIKVVFGGETMRDDWKCYQWKVTVSTKAGDWNFPYFCGLGQVEKPKFPKHHFMHTVKPKRPSNDDILHSLIMDASAANENFSEWCANYGYDDDSIKALNTYQACVKTSAMLRKHFGREVIEELETQLQDH